MRVLNKKRDVIPAFAVYVGRPEGNQKFHFGNPFSSLSYGKAEVKGFPNSAAAVAAFRAWLEGEVVNNVDPLIIESLEERRQWILSNLSSLRGKDLVCWCAPSPCHASVLMELANR